MSASRASIIIDPMLASEAVVSEAKSSRVDNPSSLPPKEIRKRRYSELTHIAGHFLKATLPKGQMPPVQTLRILLEIHQRAPANVLVFGSGPNAELYYSVNQWGITNVLENTKRGFNRLKEIGCGFTRVNYSTRFSEGVIESCPSLVLPAWIRNTRWQIVIVDGPQGENPDSPGRQQSIMTAAELVDKSNGTVFIHDCEKSHDLECSMKYHPSPREILGKRPQLAVVSYRT